MALTDPRSKTSTYQNHIAWERIGARVASVRECAGVSGRELAHRSGLNVATVQNVESGASVPLLALLRIAKALGVGVGELIPEGVV